MGDRRRRMARESLVEKLVVHLLILGRQGVRRPVASRIVDVRIGWREDEEVAVTARGRWLKRAVFQGGKDGDSGLSLREIDLTAVGFVFVRSISTPIALPMVVKEDYVRFLVEHLGMVRYGNPVIATIDGGSDTVLDTEGSVAPVRVKMGVPGPPAGNGRFPFWNAQRWRLVR